MNAGLIAARASRQARAGAANRETDDAYTKVIVRHGRYRAAICRDGIQWLFQRRRVDFKAGGTAWDTLGYFVTRDALIRASQRETGLSLPKLHTLPANFPREVTQ